MSRVFLSHSSADKDYVEYIAGRFGKDIAIYDAFSFESGMQCFSEILSNLNITDLFVIFLSDNALNSDWVKKELNISYEAFQEGKLKQIFPIIIDPSITYADKRIPEWMRIGSGSYNLRFISSPKVAYRKIKNQLNGINEYEQSKRIPYIGNAGLLDNFKSEYYKSPNVFKCIVACGIDGVGRETFIKECLKIPQTFSAYYEPIIIYLDYNESIENLIFKLIDIGYSVDGIEDISEINNLTLDKKINYLTSQLQQMQSMREFVIFRDANVLIQNNEVAWWFNKALKEIRNELTVGIVTNFNVKKNKFSEIFIEKVNELNYADKLTLLATVAAANKIVLSRDDIKFFEKILTGHPMQIIYCIKMIEEIGLIEVKNKSSILADFASDSIIKLLNRFIQLMNYAEDKQDKLLSYIAFLANYPSVPVSVILEINSLDQEFEEFYHKLLSFCICRKTGVNNDLLSISPSMRDYIERSGKNLPKVITEHLNNEFLNFKEYLKTNNLDEYCYSQIEHNLKELVIKDDYKRDYKYLYPSIILKAIVQLYNNQNYPKIINICKSCIEFTLYWDKAICNSFYFYYGLTLAHMKDNLVFEIVKTELRSEFVLEKVQADFILGFYYKLIAQYDKSLDKFNKCLEEQSRYDRARRELVEVYVNIEDYDLALMYAEDNYLRHQDNIFNICQYFKCLVRAKSKNIDKLKELLEKASEADKYLTSSKQFYPEIKSLYYRIVEKNYDRALQILEEHEHYFDNKIYYLKNVFDIYEDKKDLKAMKSIFAKICILVEDQRYFLPLLVRRECVINYLEYKDFSRINLILQRSRVTDAVKVQIIKHIKSINLKA